MFLEFGEFNSIGVEIFDAATVTFRPPSTPVENPRTLADLGLGLAGLGFARRRRNA
jgi:hypothetical protein